VVDRSELTAMTLTEEILKQLPGDVLGGLRHADRLLASLRQGTAPVPMVKQSQLALGKVDWDVVVCGGTLGIIIAVPQLGWRVALIERVLR